MLTFSLMLHAKIGFPWTLNLFAIGVYFWLGCEIAHYQLVSPAMFVESAGSWSYSLYLMHGPLAEWFNGTGFTLSSPVLVWICRTGVILILSYLFYLLVEKPSHQLARWVGKKVQRPKLG